MSEGSENNGNKPTLVKRIQDSDDLKVEDRKLLEGIIGNSRDEK